MLVRAWRAVFVLVLLARLSTILELSVLCVVRRVILSVRNAQVLCVNLLVWLALGLCGRRPCCVVVVVVRGVCVVVARVVIVVRTCLDGVVLVRLRMVIVVGIGLVGLHCVCWLACLWCPVLPVYPVLPLLVCCCWL